MKIGSLKNQLLDEFQLKLLMYCMKRLEVLERLAENLCEPEVVDF
jgi:hypothetical protein